MDNPFARQGLDCETEFRAAGQIADGGFWTCDGSRLEGWDNKNDGGLDGGCPGAVTRGGGCAQKLRRVGVVEWWSGGVVEWWSDGVMEWWVAGLDHLPITPMLQHSVGFLPGMALRVIEKSFVGLIYLDLA